MKTVKVKVLKAGKDTYWYHKHIGETFECYSRVTSFQVAHNDYGAVRFIQAEDCVLLDWIDYKIPYFNFRKLKVK